MHVAVRARAHLQISGLLSSRRVHLNTYDANHAIILSLMCRIFILWLGMGCNFHLLTKYIVDCCLLVLLYKCTVDSG